MQRCLAGKCDPKLVEAGLAPAVVVTHERMDLADSQGAKQDVMPCPSRAPPARRHAEMQGTSRAKRPSQSHASARVWRESRFDCLQIYSVKPRRQRSGSCPAAICSIK